jgi:TonB family protein
MATSLHDFKSTPPLRFWGPKVCAATAGKWGQSAMKVRSVRQWFVLSIGVVALLCIAGPRTHAQNSTRKVIKRVEPVYPETLRERGIGGTVRLKVTVRADGAVRDVQVEGGNPILAESAARAVKQWRYAPGDNEAITEVTIHFGDSNQ